MRTTETLVVGGGISGLTVAYDLARARRSSLVVEKEPRLGGLVHTVREGGFVMDAGPDAFLTQKPQAVALTEELGLSSELVPTHPELRKVYVWRRGELHPMPEGMRLTAPTRALPLLRSHLFSPAGKLRMLLEPLVPPRTRDTEESVASFVRRRFGREALERVGEPLLAGIHTGDPERLSMDRLFPRLVELERRFGSVVRGMKAEGPAPGATAFVSLRTGMSRLVDHLAERLPKENVLRGEPVVSLRGTSEGFRSRLGSGEEIGSQKLVLALPLRECERLLAPAFPGAARALSSIPTVSTAVVFHALPKQQVHHPLDGYGIVVPGTEPSRLLAVTFVSTKLPERSPDSHVLLRTFVGGLRDPGALELGDEDLVRLSESELRRMLGRFGNVSFSRVVRWIDRTPQVEVGHGDRLARLERALSEKEGLFVVGNGLWAVGIPDCVGVAREVAATIRKTPVAGRG